MWIRSQDKRLLINCAGFLKAATQQGYNIEAYINGRSNTMTVASYSNEEQVERVFDMLEKLIYDYQLGGVFQMPQDNEVEQ